MASKEMNLKHVFVVFSSCAVIALDLQPSNALACLLPKGLFISMFCLNLLEYLTPLVTVLIASVPHEAPSPYLHTP